MVNKHDTTNTNNTKKYKYSPMTEDWVSVSEWVRDWAKRRVNPCEVATRKSHTHIDAPGQPALSCLSRCVLQVRHVFYTWTHTYTCSHVPPSPLTHLPPPPRVSACLSYITAAREQWTQTCKRERIKSVGDAWLTTVSVTRESFKNELKYNKMRKDLVGSSSYKYK